MPSPPVARRALLTLVACTLAACGFHPLYSEETLGTDEPALAAVKVNAIADRIGQQLALSLRASFNPNALPVDPRYGLSVGLSVTRTDLGIQRDASSTRGRVDMYASLTLVEYATGKTVYTSRAQSTAAFNILTDAYAAAVAEDDARTRCVRDLTTEIRTRLALFLRDQNKTAKRAG
jgi:LPS-assembly lipoprotein